MRPLSLLQIMLGFSFVFVGYAQDDVEELAKRNEQIKNQAQAITQNAGALNTAPAAQTQPSSAPVPTAQAQAKSPTPTPMQTQTTMSQSLQPTSGKFNTVNDAETWSFNPLDVKRDPFSRPPEPEGRKLGELERFDLGEMQLVAILTGLGPPQAMVVVPGGVSHIVQVGDGIGRRNGKIEKITSNELIVRESFKDFQNRIKTDVTTLILAD